MAKCPPDKRRYIIVQPSRIAEFENSIKAYDRDAWNEGSRDEPVDLLLPPTAYPPEFVSPNPFWDFIHTNYRKKFQWRIVVGKRESQTAEWALVQFNNADDWLHCKLKWKKPS
jgi:hypothetical protein